MTRQSSEYKVWCGMKQRCFNPNDRAYRHYGGRGITMCEEWRNDFAAFFSAMGPRPSRHHSIDRINNDGNYEPGNCRWATHLEQARNKYRKPPLYVSVSLRQTLRREPGLLRAVAKRAGVSLRVAGQWFSGAIEAPEIDAACRLESAERCHA